MQDKEKVIKTHEELFRLFSRNDYDAMDSIRLYMISNERALLDAGDPEIVKMTAEQLHDSTFAECSLKKENDKRNESVMSWMARVYCLLRFSTDKSSVEIVNRVMPVWLCRAYFEDAELRKLSDEDCVKRLIELCWHDVDGLRKGNGVIGFHGSAKQYGYLSNWYLSKFTVDGKCFTSMEQWIMYSKAILFSDEAMADQIMHKIRPDIVKRLGRKVSGYTDSKWAAERYEILVKGLSAKFSQSDELRELLLATGDYTLAEFAKRDRIYGIGMDDSDYYRFDPSKWYGQNLLGKALMQVREQLAGK